ncbi:MAG: valine--tRNA ligase [Verrucomicrobia bacterium]|nr:valine--tRNA ligase [Verrucomicrobiota bacterium]
MSELPKTYDPKQVESKWYAEWLARGLFHADAARGGEPYCIVIPPPNVTGILHMGHALNSTIQDVLTRWQRMRGCNAVWVPGTDHAGIATQNVVERELKKQGKRRHDLGREAFVEKVWEWRGEKGGTIIRQLKTLGCSCDWDRERFTMDPGLSHAVEEVFIRLFDKGLIYRGDYIVNWCPRCTTALSDEESEHEESRGHLYHIRYRLKDGGPTDWIVVATTRPETLLGDVAVAMNPKDERYLHLAGRTLILPALGREIPFIQDDYVDPKFGTGLVKVTPAHDPNDFAMGQRHHLAPVNVMDDRGAMNEAAGPYAGLDRFECRKRLLADLERDGLIEKIEDHVNAVGHCYRCHTVVEPRLSRQWFVRMKPLAGPAADAVRSGEIRFVPDRWTGVYLQWMDGIRDWCISRQIWWGHRIPVFYCDACGHTWAARGKPAGCPVCKDVGIRQDPDVLDTWFSSWLWPFSVFGWPEKGADLARYYPTQTLVTASEIIFFWVARMIMAGFEFMGGKPFSTVYIHGTVRDDQGRKMSKSLGNSIDPLAIIETYSADALRSSLMMLTATGQDVYISNEKFEVGRNFATKIWNAARFMQMQAPGAPPPGDFEAPALDPASLAPDDIHILAKLQDAIAACDDALEKFRFNDYALALYDFVWHQFCDWYVEYSKDALQGGNPARRAAVLSVMHHVFASALRLLHPLMPFITEELWHGMGYAARHDTIVRAPWPRARDAAGRAAWGLDAATVAYVEDKHDLIRVTRTLRADVGLQPRQEADVTVRAASPEIAARLEADRTSIASLARAGTVRINAAFEPPRAMPSAVSRLGTVFLSVEGLIDTAAERAKVLTQISQTDAGIAQVDGKLSNANFVQRAKPEAVEQQRTKRAELVARREKLTALLQAFGG